MQAVFELSLPSETHFVPPGDCICVIFCFNRKGKRKNRFGGIVEVTTYAQTLNGGYTENTVNWLFHGNIRTVILNEFASWEIDSGTEIRI